MNFYKNFLQNIIRYIRIVRLIPDKIFDRMAIFKPNFIESDGILEGCIQDKNYFTKRRKRRLKDAKVNLM